MHSCCRCVSRAASRQAVAGGGSHCGGLRVAQTALRCSPQGRAAELATRCALRSDSRGESETKRASRADPAPALLAATEIAPAGHRLPRSRGWVRHWWRANIVSAKACADTRQCASKAPSSAGLAATREARTLTSLPRLFERSAQRVASSAAGRKTEQRRAVAAGDRFSEALTGVRARLCRAVQRAEQNANIFKRPQAPASTGQRPDPESKQPHPHVA